MITIIILGLHMDEEGVFLQIVVVVIIFYVEERKAFIYLGRKK